MLKDSRDLFNIDQQVGQVTKLVTDESNLFSPILIDGVWGIGKTKFCSYLKSDLETNSTQRRVLYLDAFCLDHTDNAFQALLWAVYGLIGDEDKDKSIRKNILKFLIYGSKILSKAVLNIDFDKQIDEFAALFGENFSIAQNIEDLKSSLRALPDDYIFIIDELDRCKPDFALALLEQIKHIFDLPNFRFILVADKNVLIECVNHKYGDHIDGSKYLEKFIAYEFPIRNSRPNKTESKAYQYFSELCKDYDLPEMPKATLVLLLNHHSLRDMEKLMRFIKGQIILGHIQQITNLRFYAIYHYVFYRRWLLKGLTERQKCSLPYRIKLAQFDNPIFKDFTVLNQVLSGQEVTDFNDPDLFQNKNLLDTSNWENLRDPDRSIDSVVMRIGSKINNYSGLPGYN